MRTTSHHPDHLDALLSDHDTLQNVDQTIATLGLIPRPDVLREQCAVNEVDPDRAELVVALVGRRLSSMEAPL